MALVKGAATIAFIPDQQAGRFSDLLVVGRATTATALNAEYAENAENGGYWVTANGNSPFQAATARERNAENSVNLGKGENGNGPFRAATARERNAENGLNLGNDAWHGHPAG